MTKQPNPATNGTHNGVSLTAHKCVPAIYLLCQQPKDGNLLSPVQPLLSMAKYGIDVRCCISVPQGTIVLAAESEEEQVQWMEMLQESGKV